MKAAIHRECGQVAFYLDDHVTVRDGINSRTAYDLDGNHPAPNSPMRCYSCGATENLHLIIDWEDNSYAVQQRRDEEEKPYQARLASVPLAEKGV